MPDGVLIGKSGEGEREEEEEEERVAVCFKREIELVREGEEIGMDAWVGGKQCVPTFTLNKGSRLFQTTIKKI